MIVPVWCGELSSVFKGNYQSRPVAVKVMQLYTSNREATLRVRTLVIINPIHDLFRHATQKFCKEAVIWRHLRHPNILPLTGVTIGSERCSMVSDWMENGTIKQFIEMNPDANRIELVGSVLMQP